MNIIFLGLSIVLFTFVWNHVWSKQIIELAYSKLFLIHKDISSKKKTAKSSQERNAYLLLEKEVILIMLVLEKFSIGSYLSFWIRYKLSKKIGSEIVLQNNDTTAGDDELTDNIARIKNKITEVILMQMIFCNILTAVATFIAGVLLFALSLVYDMICWFANLLQISNYKPAMASVFIIIMSASSAMTARIEKYTCSIKNSKQSIHNQM